MGGLARTHGSTSNRTLAAGRVPTRHLRRLVRFGAVGAAGVLVNTALLALLVEVAGLGRPLAAVVATEGAIISNFVLNDRWTFRDARSSLPWPRRAWRYHTVAVGGLAISVAVFTSLLRASSLHYAVANLGAISAATLWNYAMNARFTWRHRGVDREGRERPVPPRAPAGKGRPVSGFDRG